MLVVKPSIDVFKSVADKLKDRRVSANKLVFDENTGQIRPFPSQSNRGEKLLVLRLRFNLGLSLFLSDRPSLKDNWSLSCYRVQHLENCQSYLYGISKNGLLN